MAVKYGRQPGTFIIGQTGADLVAITISPGERRFMVTKFPEMDHLLCPCEVEEVEACATCDGLENNHRAGCPELLPEPTEDQLRELEE